MIPQNMAYKDVKLLATLATLLVSTLGAACGRLAAPASAEPRVDASNVVSLATLKSMIASATPAGVSAYGTFLRAVGPKAFFGALSERLTDDDLLVGGVTVRGLGTWFRDGRSVYADLAAHPAQWQAFVARLTHLPSSISDADLAKGVATIAQAVGSRPSLALAAKATSSGGINCMLARQVSGVLNTVAGSLTISGGGSEIGHSVHQQILKRQVSTTTTAGGEAAGEVGGDAAHELNEPLLNGEAAASEETVAAELSHFLGNGTKMVGRVAFGLGVTSKIAAAIDDSLINSSGCPNPIE